MLSQWGILVIFSLDFLEIGSLTLLVAGGGAVFIHPSGFS